MFNKKFLSTIVPVGCGVLAIIFATFLRGAVHKAEVLGETYHTFVRMFGVIFGGGSVVNTALNKSTSFDGGMSIFGLFAFIVVVAGIVLLVVAYLKEKDLFVLVGNAALVLGGLLMFLLLVAGTKVEGELAFADFYDGFKLGLGVYFWAILCVLGGGAGLAAKHFVKE